MKRIFTFIITLVFLVSLTSCFEDNNQKVSLIAPTGTPTLGLSEALDTYESSFDYNIVSGPDALKAAFINASYDIIVAPVNLGSTFYNNLNNFEYTFYQTIVGGSFYLVSTNELKSIKDIDNTEITVFGANSTPDVVIRSLIAYHNLNVTINYVSDVAEANSMLISGKAHTIVSAEPSISKFNATNKFHKLNLQDAWKEMSSSEYAIPQAGIFVKTSKLNNVYVQNALERINKSIELSVSNPTKLAESAVKVDPSLEKIGVATLVKAIPNCNLIYTKSNQAEIEFYFNKLIELGLGKTMGGKLPGEDFYA